jgi:hypothetical protein
MWEQLLVERIALDTHANEPFALRPLAQVSSPRSILDKTWKRVTAKDLGYADRDDMTLFGPDA